MNINMEIVINTEFGFVRGFVSFPKLGGSRKDMHIENKCLTKILVSYLSGCQQLKLGWNVKDVNIQVVSLDYNKFIQIVQVYLHPVFLNATLYQSYYGNVLHCLTNCISVPNWHKKCNWTDNRIDLYNNKKQQMWDTVEKDYCEFIFKVFRLFIVYGADTDLYDYYDHTPLTNFKEKRHECRLISDNPKSDFWFDKIEKILTIGNNLVPKMQGMIRRCLAKKRVESIKMDSFVIIDNFD